MSEHATGQSRPAGAPARSSGAAEGPSVLNARSGSLVARQPRITVLRQSLVPKPSVQFDGTIGDRAGQVADLVVAARRCGSLFELALFARCEAGEQLPPPVLVVSHWQIVSVMVSRLHCAEAGER